MRYLLCVMKMSNSTSGSEDRTVSMDGDNAPSDDEVSTERNTVGNGPLKKGPWTSTEDAILVEYVNKHGEGNWNAVQKHSGLSRCGKSCRLRWANHLRPDLRKGAFTPEEERRIIELHAKMGNKWARMAVELPGRTDNEIKNFWNTRTKRRQRAGLPIYPDDICMQTLNENAQTQNMVTFDSPHAGISSDNTFQFPAVEFKKLELNQESYVSKILDLPGSSFINHPGGSLIPDRMGSTTCNNDFQFPLPKRIKVDNYPLFDGDHNEYYPTVDQSFEISSSYDQDLNGGGIPSSSSGFFSGSHAFFNGNTSSSEPILWPQKLELPSLQYSTRTGSCNAAPSSPLPTLESVDTIIQQSILIGQTKSNRDSGLLDAVLLQSQSLNNNNNNSNVPREIPTDSSSQPDDWEAYGGDPMSPLGHSAASVFSEYTPHLSGSSLDEHQSEVKHEADEFGAKLSDREYERPNNRNYSRPDSLLGSNLFGSSSNADYSNRDDYAVSHPTQAPVNDDFGCDSNQHISGYSAFRELHYDSTEKWVDISEICRGAGNR